ncbi:MAG: hypothetical protein SFY80_02400 [Verrucomicrobiota bacterium]|nr:hypothetical protein [Verrucomicrobiota bacterium]
MKKQRGSALVMVIIAVLVVSMIIGSLMLYAMTERRLNHNQLMWIQGRSAAEGIVDLGMGELVERFNNIEAFPKDTLRSDRNPLFLTDRFFEYYAKTTKGDQIAHVVLPSAYNKSAAPGTYPTELVGGSISATTPVYINPQDPAYEDEPDLRGSTVLTTSVSILGKATVQDYKGKQMESFAIGDLLVRDAPLFSHAIFYNMDLEIAPSPNMNIIGKVHTNGDLWYMSAGGDLKFQNLVSAAGKIRFGRMPQSGQANNPKVVSFMRDKDSSGNPVMTDNQWNGQAFDENAIGSDWVTWSANKFNYWVQSGANGMGAHKSVAMQDYVRDDPTTAVVDDALNYAYQMIMPAANTKPTDDQAYEIEKQKFAYKAGLTIEVDTATSSVTMYSYERDGKDIAYDNGAPKKIALNMPQVLLDSIVKIKPSSLYDYRELKSMNQVEVDMHRLRRAIESVDVYNNAANVTDTNLKNEAKAIIQDWGIPASKIADGTAKDDPKFPANWWNGVVYVKLPYNNPSAAPDKDGVKVAKSNWAVKLVNGSQIPNPDFARRKDIYGTTVATNVPMYVKGNYNANGTYTSGNEYNPDAAYNDNFNPFRDPVTTGQPKGKYPEAAAALIADAVTVLSNSWVDATSSSAVASRVASDTEISAAIISGIVPSGKGGSSNFYSGGVENFPRFLETWGSGRSLTYRGSMVCLFESEIATGRWGQGNVYSPPNRRWGFNTIFALGEYPPGMPMVRRYKRVNFKWLTKTEYQSALSHINN